MQLWSCSVFSWSPMWCMWKFQNVSYQNRWTRECVCCILPRNWITNKTTATESVSRVLDPKTTTLLTTTERFYERSDTSIRIKPQLKLYRSVATEWSTQQQLRSLVGVPWRQISWTYHALTTKISCQLSPHYLHDDYSAYSNVGVVYGWDRFRN